MQEDSSDEESSDEESEEESKTEQVKPAAAAAKEADVSDTHHIKHLGLESSTDPIFTLRLEV